jgi:hypothetical protein
MSKARGDPMIHDLEGKLRHGLFCFAIPIDGEGAILTRNIVPRPRLELIRARRPGLLLDERAEDRPHYVQEDSPSITVRDATIAGLESMKKRGEILGGSASVPAITSKRAWTGPERGATAARRGPYRDKRRLSRSERECD